MMLSFTSLNASYYKGFKLYKKNCIECHGLAVDCVGNRDIDEWNSFFISDAIKLYDAHSKVIKNDKKRTKVDYFKSDNFKKNIKNYNDFFKHYASDSGNIPVCE